MQSPQFESRHFIGAPDPFGVQIRRVLAGTLLQLSAVLARASSHLAGSQIDTHVTSAPELEFYADSGAPEGALYVDGKLVGWLLGVRRL